MGCFPNLQGASFLHKRLQYFSRHRPIAVVLFWPATTQITVFMNTPKIRLHCRVAADGEGEPLVRVLSCSTESKIFLKWKYLISMIFWLHAPSELDLPGRPPPPIFQMHLENNEETHAAWLRLLERTTRDIESSHSFAAPFVHFSGTSASDHAIPPTNPGNFCPSANEIVQIMYHNTHPSLRMPPPSDALPAIPAARWDTIGVDFNFQAPLFEPWTFWFFISCTDHTGCLSSCHHSSVRSPTTTVSSTR